MRKWALIIGGSSGIGLATAKKLGSHGFNLLIIHRDRRSALPDFELEIERLRTKTGIRTFNLDATNPEKISDCISQISLEVGNDRIDTLVHSLSRGNLKPMISSEGENQLSQQDLTLTFESMGTNLLTWVHRLKGLQLLSDQVRIITLTSAGSYRYWKSYGAVGTAKAALEAMTKYLAVELAGTGARVNTIEAGITDTPSLKMIPGYEDLKTWATGRNPSGRMTRPTDVADAIFLLTLPEAHWINGSIIKVDGGEHLL